jgi:NAD(P)-dependent dehydrogenase (short-subunit alcohol dehydrogenase family)
MAEGLRILFLAPQPFFEVRGTPLAVLHMTRALAVDLAPLRVNAVCPGFVLTEVWNSIPADRREEQIKQMTQRQPLPRAADPKEVAEAYLYLMRGGFSTGQVLVVDGGRTLI